MKTIALLALMLLLVACSDATTGRRVVLHTRITADVDKPITNAAGWTLTFDKVAVSAGPLYYFEGAPLVARSGPTLLDRLLGIGVAHAHPGHYTEGDALGQMLEASSFDLKRGP